MSGHRPSSGRELSWSPGALAAPLGDALRDSRAHPPSERKTRAEQYQPSGSSLSYSNTLKMFSPFLF